MNRILVLFAHPSQNRSEVNLPLFKATQDIAEVTCVDLYAEYPRFVIDIDKEQQRLLAHDIIVFMFPMYWYSTPSILKEWQDLVLEYGFAYGKGGDALHGKRFFCAITTGGAEQGYQHHGYNHFTINELLQPIQQTAYLVGMDYLPPYVLFGARNAVDEGRVACHLTGWRRLIEKLQHQLPSSSSLKSIEFLNQILEEETA